jgi:hypothetical protein
LFSIYKYSIIKITLILRKLLHDFSAAFKIYDDFEKQNYESKSIGNYLGTSINYNIFEIRGYNVSMSIEQKSENFINQFNTKINKSKLDMSDSDDLNSEFLSQDFPNINSNIFYKKGDIISEFDLKFDSPENFWIILKNKKKFSDDLKEWCLEKISHFSDKELMSLKIGIRSFNIS